MNIFNQEVVLELFLQNYFLFIAALFFGACGFTYYIIPKVLWVSHEKNLTVAINDRSSHKVETPSFGGFAFYMTLILVLALIQCLRLNFVGNHLIAAITILFMVGLKDDLVVSTAKAKFFGQIAATCFIIFSPELHLNNLYGFLGIYEIPERLGFILTGLISVAIINAYNLIDGIDGLAAFVGIFITGVYAWVFYETGYPFYVLVSISVAGILTAYLKYNFSKGHQKIFMGDSGSLIIGLIIAFLTLKYLVLEPNVSLLKQGCHLANRPLFLLCVLFIPVFDTFRVMIIRIFRGNSPFSADRNHAHHVLLDLGYSHFKASLLLISLNILIAGIYFYFSNKLEHAWLVLIIVLCYGLTFVIFHQLKSIILNSASKSQSKQIFEN